MKTETIPKKIKFRKYNFTDMNYDPSEPYGRVFFTPDVLSRFQKTAVTPYSEKILESGLKTIEYFTELFETISDFLPVKKTFIAPKHSIRYGIPLYYTVFKNIADSPMRWYIIFSRHSTGKRIIYIVRHIYDTQRIPQLL